MDKQILAEQILKAMNCCSDDPKRCNDCIFKSTEPNQGCNKRLMKNALIFVHSLQAENDALQKKLRRSVELPCKLGAPIYYSQYFCDYKGCRSEDQPFCGGCKEMIDREKRNEKYVVCQKPFELSDLSKIGKKYFVTPEEVEARIKRKKEKK